MDRTVAEMKLAVLDVGENQILDCETNLTKQKIELLIGQRATSRKLNRRRLQGWGKNLWFNVTCVGRKVTLLHSVRPSVGYTNQTLTNVGTANAMDIDRTTASASRKERAKKCLADKTINK